MQLRYSYRLYPLPAQQQALARAFGCARVVFNDALAARREAREAGEPYISDAAMSARLTAAKDTPQRAWVTVEDLAVKGLARTWLAKSVHDAGWSAFVAMLEYKAKLYGREFRKIGRFEPTSQICSECGVKDGPKPLQVRKWTCAACGIVHDRDINAAKNIAALGRREAENARGGQVGPLFAAAQAREAGSLGSAA